MLKKGLEVPSLGRPTKESTDVTSMPGEESNKGDIERPTLNKSANESKNVSSTPGGKSSEGGVVVLTTENSNQLINVEGVCVCV